MNDIIEAMETRRSIRQFKPDMPRKEDLQQIIEAGLYAANGRGRQGAIILAVTNRELRDRLSALNREIGGFPEGKDPFYGAPAVLIVLADKSCPTGIYDGSLAMGNLMLAAHALGLGSIWIHRAKEEFERPEYKQLLNDLGDPDEQYTVGEVVQFPPPDAQGQFAGRVAELSDEAVLFDFNHPLAGQPVAFEVHILGVL